MKTRPVTEWECPFDIIEPFSFRYEAPVTVRNVRRCPSQFGRLLRYQSPGCAPPSWRRRLKVAGFSFECNIIIDADNAINACSQSIHK